MKKNAFLIETLRHTISDLLSAELSKQERELLALMATTDEFTGLFDIGEKQPELPQLSERAFSELTGGRFNTLDVAYDLLVQHQGYCTREGYAVVKYTPAGGEWFMPQVTRLIFRLIDEGAELVATHDTSLAVYKVTNTETNEEYRLNFEVIDHTTAIDLMNAIRKYLPEHVTIVIKKL